MKYKDLIRRYNEHTQIAKRNADLAESLLMDFATEECPYSVDDIFRISQFSQLKNQALWIIEVKLDIDRSTEQNHVFKLVCFPIDEYGMRLYHVHSGLKDFYTLNFYYSDEISVQFTMLYKTSFFKGGYENNLWQHS